MSEPKITVDYDKIAWVRRKLEQSKLPCCAPRTDDLVGTFSEIQGWLHCVVADAQSWHRWMEQHKAEREDRDALIARLRTAETALSDIQESALRHMKEDTDKDRLYAGLKFIEAHAKAALASRPHEPK